MQIQKPKIGYKLVRTNLRHYETIPEEWQIILLIKLVKEIKTGFAEGERHENGIMQLRMNNISDDGTLNFEKTLKVPIPEDIVEYELDIDDVLFNNTNSLDLIGKSTIIHRQLNCTFSNHLTRIRTKKERLLPYFLLLLFLKYKKEALFRSICNTHVGQSGIGKNELLKIGIILPYLNEQQKIVSILSNVDSLIQQTQKSIEQTQRLKKGLMQKLLTKGLGHTKFKETEFGAYFIRGETPKSWKIDTVKNSSEKLAVGFVGTCEPYYVEDGGIPLLRTTNIKEGEFDLSNLKYVTKEFHERNKKSQVKEGDILVSRHGENGEACLVGNISEANCLNIVIIRPKKDLFLPEFFELAFNSHIVRRQIQRTTGGGVQDVVNTAEIGKAKMIIPDLNEQSRIVSIFNNLRLQIQKQQENKSNLETLKKGLMQKLLTGQIRVKI